MTSVTLFGINYVTLIMISAAMALLCGFILCMMVIMIDEYFTERSRKRVDAKLAAIAKADDGGVNDAWDNGIKAGRQAEHDRVNKVLMEYYKR